MHFLDHVTAVGSDLREGAVHLGQRLGFTLSRTEDPLNLRVLFQEGHLDLRQEEVFQWHLTRFTMRLEGLSPAQEGVLSEQAPKGTLPLRVAPDSPRRPQEEMEPGRAAAAVQHANTAVGLAGIMLLVPEVEPAVALYERLLGVSAGEPFSDSTLGVEGRSIPVGEQQRISLVTAASGTGPAARVRREIHSGICGVIIRVQSLQAVRESLRKGAVYAFANEGSLVTSSAVPGYGMMLFET